MIGMAANAAPSTSLQGTFRALADPTRRDILVLLSQQDMTIADVAGRFDMTRAAVKKHLTVLEQGRIISVRTQGRERINRLEPLALKEISDWLGYFDRFWDDRFAALHDAVRREQTSKTQKPTGAKSKDPKSNRKTVK